MRHYEIMLLIHPDQSERARVMMDRYVGIIEGGEGQVHRNEDLGRRMLAYPIAKVQKAHYMLLNVECGQETLDELVGALHFSDAVLRHLVIRRDEAVNEQSVLARAAEKEAARENREFPYDRELAHGRRSPRDEGGEAKAADKASGDATAAEEPDQAKGAPADAGEAAPAEEQQSGEQAEAATDEAAEDTGNAPAAEAEGGAGDQANDDAAAEDEAGPVEDPETEEDAEPEAAADQGEDEATDDEAQPEADVAEDDVAEDGDEGPKEKTE